jgi:hypothetical protein
MISSPQNTPLARAFRSLVWLVVLALGFAGCSPNKPGAVTGKVTYKGKAVTGGTMKLYPVSGKIDIPVTLKHDGTFVSTNIPPGDYKVTVETESVKNAPDPNRIGFEIKDRKLPKDVQPRKFDTSGLPRPAYVEIPRKYADLKTTDLTLKIAQGKKDIVLELKD